MRQQNTVNQPTKSTRKHSGSHRVQTRDATMTTEYQDKFLNPSCYTTMVSASKLRGPYSALKGTNNDTTTLRTTYLAHKSTYAAQRSTYAARKHPPKAPKPSQQPPKAQCRCSSAPQIPACSVANQVTSNMDDYTSVYKNSYQAWKLNKRKPFKLSDSLKVNQGLMGTNGTFKVDRSQNNSGQAAANAKDVQEPQPFESITSYRADYVTHPLQPRKRREKPAYQSKGLPLEPKLLDVDSELFQQFKTWSLENKLHGRGTAKESGPPADRDHFLSTTHADYVAHKCERTKPFLPSMQTQETSTPPFQETTTMRDDYVAWDTPRRFPSVRKDHDLPKKSIFSPFSPTPCPKLKETEVCNCSCNATKKTPAENGAFSSSDSISPGTEQSRMGWASSLDRVVTWADGGICEEASQDHQMMSCMTSTRS